MNGADSKKNKNKPLFTKMILIQITFYATANLG